jgi:uncharacterized protein YqjF (DUF2071 family)
MLNYAIDAALLQPFVPAGTELDQHDGRTWVSLIGFEFNETRLLGHAIPFHQSFEEVNLRFYVRRESRRGVVFIRELVPKLAVSTIARVAYGERYSCVPMTHRVERGTELTNVEFSWGAGGARCSLAMRTSQTAYLPEDGSLAQFITEHYWGYSIRSGSTVEYQVEHPQWRVQNADSAKFTGDGAKYYGADFGKILACAPDSAFLANGSAVTVFKGTQIK